MKSPESTVLQKVVVNLITRRAGSGTDATAVARAARRAHDDLVAVLAPLISQPGVDALVARAVHLAQREYPSEGAAEEQTAEPFGPAVVWLERLDPPIATAAAATIFATFASLLAALIGEALTTRYLRKAWPDGFSEARPEETQA